MLVWFRVTLTTFRARITTIHLYMSELYLKHYWFHFFRTRCRNRQQWRAAEILSAIHTQPALSREENWEEMERGMEGKGEEWEVRRGDALFCLNVNLGAHVPTPRRQSRPNSACE